MEFGKISAGEISKIDHKFAPDSAFTNNILATAGKSADPLFYAGCAKWLRKDWVGIIYPDGTKEKDFLDLYIQHFNSIELNATHYKIYGPELIKKWADAAKNEDFLFCPKMSKSITHFSGLVSPEAKIKTIDFLKGVKALGNHLGPIFIQVHERFSPAKKDDLYLFLSRLPKNLQFFVELRHEEWYSNKTIKEEWKNKLAELGVGMVITDASGRRDVVHMELTVPKAFIRFVGNGLMPIDYTRIDAWVLRIKKWLDKGLQELYFFMHELEEKDSPELCDYFIEQLNKKCGTGLKRVGFVGK
jgi:uncharacterized protein YecE (DUF72 family)